MKFSSGEGRGRLSQFGSQAGYRALLGPIWRPEAFSDEKRLKKAQNWHGRKVSKLANFVSLPDNRGYRSLPRLNPLFAKPQHKIELLAYVVMESIAVSEDVKEWALEAGTEYRFELDPDNSLAIKVSDYS